MAGGVALNCVANGRLAAEGPFDDVWVQPAAGDAGTALGAALFVSRQSGQRTTPMVTAALGRGWSDDDLARDLTIAAVGHQRVDDIADAGRSAGRTASSGGSGRSEYGPRSGTAACWPARPTTGC